MRQKLFTIFTVITILISLGVITITANAEAAADMPIKLGDYFKMGTYDGTPILWRCVAFEKATRQADGSVVIDSAATNGTYQAVGKKAGDIGYLPLMLADTLICNKEFDAAGNSTETGSHNRGSNRIFGGSNYWGDSNIRDWLNSSEDVVTWSCGNAPSYFGEKGFLTNFSDTEKSAMNEVTQKSLLYENDYNALPSDKRSGSKMHIYNSDILGIEENYSNAYSEQITDTMFLLDVEQVKNVHDRLGDYYKSIENYWLRSPYSAYDYGVRVVYSDGRVSGNLAGYDIYGVRPAFFLNLPSYLCGRGEKDKPYVIGRHIETAIPAVEATCTKNGATEGVKCSVCDTIIIEPTVIAAKGHNYGKWEFSLTENATEIIRTCQNDSSHKEKKNAEIQLIIPEPYVYNGGECKPKVSVKVFDGGKTTVLAEDVNYTLSYENNINAGTATVNITGIGDYSGTVKRTFNIAAKTLNVTAVEAENKTYDGTSDVNVTAVTLNGVVGEDTVEVNTENLRGTLASANAGDYTQITLQNLSLINNENDNYILHQPNITIPANVTIAKADVPAVTAGTPLNIANNLEKEYTYILSRLCPQLNKEGAAVQKDWGSRSYEIVSIKFNKDGYYDDNTAHVGTAESGGTVNNTLYLPIKFKDTEMTGKAAEVTVKISSDNYNDFINTFEVNVSNKAAVNFGGITAKNNVYNGSAWKGYTGELIVTDSNNNIVTLTPEIRYTGRLETAYSEKTDAPINAGTYSVIFRVADTDENYIGKRTVNFEISKAEGSGSVTMADFKFGDTPSVPQPSSATNGTNNVIYMYKPQGAEDSEYKSEKPSMAGKYTVKAIFAETQNFNQAEAISDFSINHDYSEIWSHDASNHWHECSCGSRTDEGTHTWNEGVVTQTATCTLEGRTRYACTVCSREKVETIAPLGHAWSNWTIKTEPTLMSKGIAERTCVRDDSHKEVFTLPVLTDRTIWKEGTRIEPTKDTDGLQQYISDYGNVTIIIPATGEENHNFRIKYEDGKAVVTVSEDGAYTVIFAAYDDQGKLLSVSAEDIQLQKCENEPIEPKQSFTKGAAVKVMLWDCLNGMKPLCKAD